MPASPSDSEHNPGGGVEAEGSGPIERYSEASIAIVVPARNEARFLPDLLQSLQRELQGSAWRWRILVADNGSTDETARIARRAGATVVDTAGSTVGQARNLAVEASESEVLVFLDADMIVSPGWARRVEEWLPELRGEDLLVVGGSIAAPPGHGWPGRVWFPVRGSEPRATRHVGSGHMLLSRHDFDALGGFDPALHASEDYDLCRRALDRGGRILEDNGLPAYHQGAPRSLGDFARRELWHGGAGVLGDLLKQRVTILSAIWLLMHLGLLCGIGLYAFGPSVWGAAIGLISLAGIAALLAGSVWRHGGLERIREIPQLAVLFYVYYWSRAVGLIRCLTCTGSSSIGRTSRI
jgi:hypothetical protein